MPLSPVPEKGEPIAPFFEGWYRNDDGSFTFPVEFTYNGVDYDGQVAVTMADDLIVRHDWAS